jgi:hypothetical protein
MPKKKQLDSVDAHRTDAHGSIARCKAAELVLDMDLAGRADAFNPAELLLAPWLYDVHKQLNA